ncbi:hypothetical protein OM076_14645 [Solirubrobacter ginsenosidimutans]|uniref:Uncharacterized protein n=1 Tax=Solirubrobacter ginsenosidimutans TaxID=490573 RepID=A0A9X3MU72_9ACTN|nr:hypothetical protein [Solirubrobacter ginsenosidimutans]MDA0161512.1 hypothetical protein [Solirubrobacter ginsenosidimutans]
MKRAALLVACLGMAACGGGGARPSPSHGGGHAVAASGGSVVDGCVKAADGDPAELMLCLASHHIEVSETIRGCVSGVRDSDRLITCIRRYAR